MSLVEMKVPTVGESVTEVTIAAWTRKEGDAVKMDEVLCELESDKATFELPAEAAGILHIRANEGDTLPIGAVICAIETTAAVDTVDSSSNGQPVQVTPAATATQPVEAAAAVAKAATPDAASAAQPVPMPSPAPDAAPATAQDAKTVEVKVPAVGESITEVTIASWTKKEGDPVKMDEVLCELESDKATFELPAEAAGTLHIVAQAGATVPVGGVVATITVGAGQGAAAPTTAPAQPASNGAPSVATAEVRNGVTPVAAAILADRGIDPKSIQGSGEGGKITKADALKAEGGSQKSEIRTEKPAAPVPQTTSPTAPQTSNRAADLIKPQTVPTLQTDVRGERRQRMTSLRRTIARRLVAVKNETAMLTTFNEVDMKPIMELRGKYKDKFKEKHGVGLGFMSFFARAICVALKEFPAVNASIDGDDIVYHDFCDISVAVSTERGLVVPVVRNADQMGFAQIEKEIITLATLARDNKLTIEQMTGGTFTITNGGVFGSMLSTPIINAPQSAILGMHNIVERAVVINGEIVVRPIMYVALSYDHRIIDGKESVSFLVRVKQLLEDPTRLLLDV
ncbi:MAG: 2-oxoglutarate dehydrogenase complex dihydrolipoyllysine-residue succinyltransferase [Cytophagaceae bacterium]|nr:2-oxoglutarate dehydrogenase complex dihydrolipoyllysine-residue succinyltransferase [Cytophagaceae bacterium]